MDLSALGSFGSSSTSIKPKGKGKKKSTVSQEDSKSISEQIFDRMKKQPNLKYKGKRDGEAEIKKYKSKWTRGEKKKEEAKLATQELIKGSQNTPFIYYIDNLDKIPGGFKYLGGFLIRITPDETCIILPKGCTGEQYSNWRIVYEERLQEMVKTERN